MRNLKMVRSKRGGGRRTGSQARARALFGTCEARSVSDKLAALTSLLPRNKAVDEKDVFSGNAVKTEEIFQETADYIIRLKTQVVVLKRLIDIYGSDDGEPEKNAVL